MNKKLLWFVAFLVVAALSCFATAKSFMLLIDLPWYIIVPMTIVIFVFSSYAFKLIMDATHNDGSIPNPKAKLWFGSALLLLAWGAVSFPTNAHTFFYMKQVGNVVNEDLQTTKTYAKQLADRAIIASEYKVIEDKCMKEFSKFSDEVKGNIGGKGDTEGFRSGFGDRANSHINRINEYLGAQYALKTVPNTNKSSDMINTQIINSKLEELNIQLSHKKSDEYQVNTDVANEARGDIRIINILTDSIRIFAETGSLWYHDNYIKQIDAFLAHNPYPRIKMNKNFIVFQTIDDEKLYTSPNIETRISRFLNPYYVMWDFLTGRVSFIFIFWLMLSILLDVLGFISFDLAFKKKYTYSSFI